MKKKFISPLLNSLDISPEQIQKQAHVLKKRISEDYGDRLFEGLLQELATMELAFNQLLLKLNLVDHKLNLLDYPLPELLSLSETTQKVTIEADFPLKSEQGFYHLEYDQKGNPFRWTGPEEFFNFDVVIKREQPWELVLRLFSALAPVNLKKIRCFVDELEIELEQKKINGIFYFQGIIPSCTGKFRTTKISFLVPKIVKNSEINPESEDHRLLGVAFSQLLIHPPVETRHTTTLPGDYLSSESTLNPLETDV
ncbi:MULTISPECIES: hypothetical protein [Planktothrix]|nr:MULTISPECIES: hypothetical protein [Planktothrix]